MPKKWLAAAIERWVRESHFMPKASDLIALAQRIQAGERQQAAANDNWVQWCAEQNDRRDNNAEIPKAIRDEQQWVPVPGGGMRLAWRSEFETKGWVCPEWLTRYNQKVADGIISKKLAQ